VLVSQQTARAQIIGHGLAGDIGNRSELLL
jgi:hypothetical protein